MKRAGFLIRCALGYPRLAWKGAREFRGTVGMTYGIYEMQEAYDAGRELANILTRRRWDQAY